MAKDVKNLSEGLEATDVAAETSAVEKTKKERKAQTSEERETLVAGVTLMKSMGNVTPEFEKVLQLAIDWNSDAEALEAAKKSVIDGFGGSAQLKDYIDAGIAADNQGYAGIAKLIPIVNNIISFYARRAKDSVKKSKSKTLLINGKSYSVNVEYLDSIVTLPAEERRNLVLAHADTKEIEVDTL